MAQKMQALMLYPLFVAAVQGQEAPFLTSFMPVQRQAMVFFKTSP